jgi:hypothetical protein
VLVFRVVGLAKCVAEEEGHGQHPGRLNPLGMLLDQDYAGGGHTSLFEDTR